MKSEERISREQVDGVNIKYVEGFDNLYAVSREGKVYSFTLHAGGRQLTPGACAVEGYLQVTLRKDGKNHQKYLHRLVAETFVPNRHPQTRPCVNHIDEDPLNNNADNLEWVSYVENLRYGTRPQRIAEAHKRYVENGGTFKKKVAQYQNGILVNVYESTKAAGRAIDPEKWNSVATAISQMCKDTPEPYHNTVRGYTFRYIRDTKDWCDCIDELRRRYPERYEPKEEPKPAGGMLVVERVMDPMTGQENLVYHESKDGRISLR